MAQSMVTRTQRRTEKRLVVWILVLVAGVAVASFALGFVLGRQGQNPSDLNVEVVKQQAPVVTKSVPPPPAEVPAPAVTPPEAEKLTFYDNLPKGDQAPLGSGINLPPQPSAPTTPPVQKPVAKVAEPVKAAPKPNAAVTADPAGAFVIQVASFRAEDDARKLVARLQKRAMNATIERADLGSKGVWYRVLCGPYGERAVADRAAAELQKEERLSALVRRR